MNHILWPLHSYAWWCLEFSSQRNLNSQVQNAMPGHRVFKKMLCNVKWRTYLKRRTWNIQSGPFSLRSNFVLSLPLLTMFPAGAVGHGETLLRIIYSWEFKGIIWIKKIWRYAILDISSINGWHLSLFLSASSCASSPEIVWSFFLSSSSLLFSLFSRLLIFSAWNRVSLNMQSKFEY